MFSRNQFYGQLYEQSLDFNEIIAILLLECLEGSDL